MSELFYEETYQIGHGVSYDSRINLLITPDITVPEIPEDLSDLLFEFYLGIRALNAHDRLKHAPNISVLMHNKCQLKCTYCFAEVQDQFEKVYADPAKVAETVRKFKTPRVHLLGGEPLLDIKYLKELLGAIKHVQVLSVTTNAIGITDEVLRLLKSHCEKLNIGISFEPKGWGKRLTNNDKHSNDVVRQTFKRVTADLLFKRKEDTYVGSTMVFPISGNVPFMPVGDIIEEWKDVFNGNLPYEMKWQAETDPHGDLKNNFPEYLIKTLDEEMYEILSADSDNERLQLGLSGRSDKYADHLIGNQLIPSISLACGPGVHSITVGHDNQIYSCPMGGAVHDKSELLDECTDREDIFPDIHKSHFRYLLEPICRKCPIKYQCGKTCGRREQGVCEFNRGMTRLFFAKMAKFYPEKLKKVQEYQLKTLNYFVKNIKELKPFIRSEEWQSIVTGTIDMELLKKKGGMYLDLVHKLTCNV